MLVVAEWIAGIVVSSGAVAGERGKDVVREDAEGENAVADEKNSVVAVAVGNSVREEA